MRTLGATFWKKYFTAYDALNEAIPYQELMNSLVRSLNIRKGDRVLDAGAGTCNLSMLLKKAGADVTALDSSRTGLNICMKKDSTLKIVEHNLCNPLPFESNFFDKVVSNNTLYLIDKEKRAHVLKEFYRTLKPGGIFALSNIHTGFKPMAIYKEHIRLSRERFGVIRTFIQIIKFIIPTIKIFYYNGKIKKSHKEKNLKTTFFEMDEQHNLMKNSGFLNVSKNISVYAGQGILSTAVK